MSTSGNLLGRLMDQPLKQASAVADTPRTASLYVAVGPAKHNASTATLAYALQDDTLNLDYLGRAQRVFACAAHKDERAGR